MRDQRRWSVQRRFNLKEVIKAHNQGISKLLRLAAVAGPSSSAQLKRFANRRVLRFFLFFCLWILFNKQSTSITPFCPCCVPPPQNGENGKGNTKKRKKKMEGEETKPDQFGGIR
jgi:hypothetical protein